MVVCFCKVFVFSRDICAQWKVENYDWKMPQLPETTMTILLKCTEKKENNSCVSWEVLSGICQKLWTQGWLHTSCAQMIAMNAVDNAFSWRSLNTNRPKQHPFLSGLRNFKNVSKIALPKFPQKREHKTHFPTNYHAESVFTTPAWKVFLWCEQKIPQKIFFRWWSCTFFSPLPLLEIWVRQIARCKSVMRCTLATHDVNRVTSGL